MFSKINRECYAFSPESHGSIQGESHKKILLLFFLVEKNENLNEPIQLGNYLFNLKTQTLQINSEIVTLTHREAHLLYHLINNKNEVLERSFILKKLWGDDDFFNARSMDVFITKLRKKLNKDDTLQIVNVRGYGYKLIC